MTALGTGHYAERTMIETKTKKKEPTPVHRKDYRAPDHWIDEVDLEFVIREEETIVRARLRVRRNAEVNDGSRPLVLVGEDLELRRAAVAGEELVAGELECTEGELRIAGLPDSFLLETEVSIHPERNTRLSGLYASSGNLCTQCEAEGFRRITYFLDRPDVMARYTVRIEADRGRYPVLLSNGNRVAAGEGEDGRHWVKWEDPFPKPCYLFALVAGDLECHRSEFTTMSGRRVPLEIWVEPRNIDRCEHAMRSLKRAMKWDEEVFGLEVDLDLYMIFVADDFNMGAMENKGLNVFNSKYVLASPATATDDDYESIEGVIAHEYFHNWTGNRVTCRDWFQLTLKEGLTVFRDQEFSADMASRPVKRIQEVRALRANQFAEDAGPMAHPIRPESYVEMNNFYTATVYIKGAEIIRIYHTLLGREGFRRGMDLYFRRHDGQAVTCDDFRAAMADANGVDLTQLELWYLQAGTPTVKASGQYDGARRTYTLALSQSTPPVAGCAQPRPLHMPVRIGLLAEDGHDLPLRLQGEHGGAATERVLELTEAEQTFLFVDVPEEPVASLFRDFSAPIKLQAARKPGELAFLLSNDRDPFNRWDAGQELAAERILSLAADHARGRQLVLEDALIAAFRDVLNDPRLDGSIKSLMLVLPPETFLAQSMEVIDPEGLHAAREFVVRELARALRSDLERVHAETAAAGAYSIEKAEIDRRRLHNLALSYLTSLDEDETTAQCVRQFETADNMTDTAAAFACLVGLRRPERERAVASFHARWRKDPLVLDKWFQVQASSGAADTFERVLALAEHPDFSLANPNRARSLLGAFGVGNPAHFHRADGRGYAFLADQVLALDARNPQVAARIVAAFNQWKRYDEGRRELMREQLERMRDHDGLSKDVTEIVGRALAR